MTDTTKILPKLRFPEFKNAGEWEEVKLGEIIYVINPPKKLHSCDYRQKGLYPIIDQSQNYICGYTDGKEGLLNEDKDFLIVFGDHTCVLKSVDFPFVQGADGIKIFRSKMIDCVDTKYIYQFLLSKPIAANEYKRHFSELKEIDIVFPHSIKEQQKIAAFLTSLDEQISAHTKKLEALKAHKKGLMQQLFPANGEKTPKLRFPEFKNDGEWKEVRLGEVCAVNRGVRVTRNDLNNDWPYPVFQNTDSPLGFYNKFNVKANNPFVIIGGSAGLVGFCNTNFWAADDCVFFGDSNCLDKYFLYLTLLFHSIEIKNNIRGGNIPRIDRKSLEQLKVSIPPLPEQQKIASFLISIDEMIQAQDDKIRKLKTYKNGLMQQMFPSVETPYYDVSAGGGKPTETPCYDVSTVIN